MMVSKYFATFLCSLAFVAAACSNDGSKESQTKPATSQTASEQAPAATNEPAPTGTGAISGRVAFEGTPPPPQKLRMNADPYCASANEGSPGRRNILVGAEGGLQGAVVYVVSESTAQGGNAPEEAVVLDQTSCGYSPRILALRVGQPLEIRNNDNTLHNVHALPKNSKGFNIGMPTKGMKSVRKFASPEVFVRIKCDVHPWMESFVAVFDHPSFSLTDENGQFEIGGLPAGDHTLVAAHPKLGIKELSVSIAEGETAQANFTFSK